MHMEKSVKIIIHTIVIYVLAFTLTVTRITVRQQIPWHYENLS